jgi:hypothetical protein
MGFVDNLNARFRLYVYRPFLRVDVGEEAKIIEQVGSKLGRICVPHPQPIGERAQKRF